MKKINYPILLIILLFFINGCTGYKPIFSSVNSQFEIADYVIKGDKKLGAKIYSKLHNLSKSKKNNQNTRSIKLMINTSKNKNATSKDSAGKILEYKITLNTDIKVTDFVTKAEILNQIFTSSLTYKVQNKYSDTINLENRIIESLINKTYQELVIRLSQKIL